MANLFGLAGAQPQKQTRFAPIYTGRWSSGIWTNRSPLRDAATTRIVEKFYGAAGDALIAGTNVEITNRLSLARRPGNSVYDSNSYASVDRFYDFHLFSLVDEQIKVMVDQATALYSLFNGVKTLVWTKSANGGQSYMQSVGNSLYFGNGVDNKKWLQTLTAWASSFNWATNSTPLFTTFFIDPNGNIQQLTTAGVSATTAPTWSTTVPSVSNSFQGGLTTDGTAVWTNRGNPIKNWGIQPPLTAVTPQVGSSRAAWKANTLFSLVSVVIDSNGNLQQVTTAGKTGTVAPTWGTSVGNITTDGAAKWTMIQTAASLVWQPHTAYASGQFIIGTATGTPCLFQLTTGASINISSNVSAYMYASATSGPVGQFTKTFPTSTGSAIQSTTTQTSLHFTGNSGPAPLSWQSINGAGEIGSASTPFTRSSDYALIILGTFNVPVAGQYSFSVAHHDGMIWGIGNGAQFVSGSTNNPIGQTQTANQGYPVLGGTNLSLSGGGVWNDNFVVNFPTAGVYGYEFNYDFWYHSGQVFTVTCNGQQIANGTPISGATQPIWPSFSTSFAPAYATVSESVGQYVWRNIGPTADFTWAASTNVTLPNTTIIDPAGNTEAPYRTGITGTTAPTFSGTLNQLTLDNPNLIWINQGAASAPPVGSVSTFQGGWQYTITLVDDLDNTVSNAAPLSVATGNFIGAAGVTIPAGAGLTPSAIDPQASYVAIFRTTDGKALPFLIPGTGSSVYTLTLKDYLTNGYFDNTPDTGLNNLISAPLAGENTPPASGAINLTFHLGRIFYSIGNVVYWTAGPDTPVGNGVNGTPPLNLDTFPSLIKRMVPTTSGLMVFTVSDVYLIQGSGTPQSPIQAGIPIMQGVGLGSYNALDINGSIIGFFTTDNQFVIIDPSSGVSYAGFPIGDQFRLNNGQPGTAWDASSVYVTWHVNGEDQGWYVADGQFGWYRLMPTPAPETGYTWSPFALVVGGVKALQSIEVTPGKHKLLLGPATSGPILNRDLSVFTDNGSVYPAYAVIGSAVLAQPGQIATVSFITTEAVRIGKPLVLGVIMDEALPYYTGPFDILKTWVNDPPAIKAKSKSLMSQRFYMSELEEEAVCRHMQIKVDLGSEAVQNELLTLTVFGGFMQES